MKTFLENLIEPKNTKVKSERFTNAMLKAMIVPLIIEQFLQLVVGLADTLMVSYAGETVVSGVSLDTSFYSIFIYVFTALATGGAVIVSQYLGRKEDESACLAASQIFFSAIVSSVFFLILLVFTGNAILEGLYGAVEPEVMAACKVYLHIVMLSFPANALYNAGAALYRTMGKTKTTMYVSIFMNLLNVAGNAIGIFVLHMGAAGVAWPTTISWYAAAVIMLKLCLDERNEVHVSVKDMFRPYSDMIRRILNIAVPNVVENGLFQISKVVLSAVLATFGTAHIAANGIGQTIWSFAAMMSIVMNPVCITTVGKCMGAGDLDEAEYYIQKMIRLTLVLAFCWNAFIVAILPLLVSLYSITAETKTLLIIIVIIHNIFAGTVQPVGNTIATSLRTAGDVKFSMYASIFCTVICRVALTFLFGVWLNMGVIGVAIAMVLDWCIKMVIMILRYRSRVWTKFSVI